LANAQAPTGIFRIGPHSRSIAMLPRFPLPFLPALALATPAAASAQQSQAHLDTPEVTLGLWDTPYRLALDYDGDGDVDVLGMDKYHDDNARAAHELALFENGGDGRLPRVWDEDWLDPVDKTAPAFVAAGNLIGDAREEFLYTWGTQVRVYQWDPAQATAILLGTNLNAGIARDATIADFDGNGHDNVAVLLGDRVQVHVEGPAGIELVDVAVAPDRWTRLLAIDTDGNGAAELLLVGPKGFALRPLARPGHPHVRPYGKRLEIEHEMPAVGDVDGDGDQDAVVFGMTAYQVLRNRNGVLFVEPPVQGGPATHLADVDQDGDLDGACCGGGDTGPDELPNDSASRFELSLNDGTGRFAPAFSIDAAGSKGLAAVTDLDLDGDVELVAGRVIHFPSGAVVPPMPELVPAKEVNHVDVDGDGDVDLGLHWDTVEENLGDGTTRPLQPTLPALAPPLRYAGPGIPGDFDGDGDQDLLTDKFSDTTYLGVYWLANEGGVVFSERGLAFVPGADLANINFRDVDSIRVQDIDLDGRLDVLMPPDWTARIYWNDGTTAFSSSFWNEPVAAVADLDGDGIQDLVQVNYSRAGVGIRKGLGGRSYGPYQDWYGVWGTIGFYLGRGDRLAVADVNADGAPDIAFVDRDRGELVLLQGTPGTLAFTTSLMDPPGWADFPDDYFLGNRVFAVDLDLDGASELVALPVRSRYFPEPPSLAIVERVGSGWRWTRQMGSPRGFVDADGDGDLDGVGSRVLLNRTRTGPPAGKRLQFGSGLAGLGGLAPKLGATGPFRAGETVTLRVAGGRGGASATLVHGRTRVDWNVGGVPVYVDPGDPFYVVTPLALDGPADAPGAGEATLSFTVAPADAGVTTYYQVFVSDPDAPGGTSASNGLELGIGIP
jgi:hypothetical protein